MSEKVCKYCKDEICVNADCPMRADYCPVPDVPGVCRYEERVVEKLTPQQCLSAAINDCGQQLSDKETADIFDSFVKIMEENGHAIQPITLETDENVANKYRKVESPKTSQVPFEPKKYVPGMTVSIKDIANDHDWVFDRKINDGRDCHETLIYVSRDKTMMVAFYDDCDGTIILFKDRDNEDHKSRFYPDQEIHFKDLMTYNDWIFQRDEKDEDGSIKGMHFITKNGEFTMCFDLDAIEHNGIGVVRKRQGAKEPAKYGIGQEISLCEVANDSKNWKLKSFNSNPFDTSCNYVSKDDKYIAEFAHQSAVGVVKAQYVPGMSVHISWISGSPYWIYAGEGDGIKQYVNADADMVVNFEYGHACGEIKKMNKLPF